MGRFKFFAEIASAALLAVAAVSAAAAQAPTNSVAGIYVDAPVFLPPPPANNSPQTIAELAELRDIAKSRTEARLEKAKADDRTEDVTIFAEVFSPTFDFKALPATWELFRAVLKAETKASGPPKKFFQRPRPWALDPTLAHCSDAAANSAYPSGHTSFGFATGVVLAAVVPERAQDVLARANDYAYSRLVCGMHYRSDLAAGQVLGTIVADRFLSDPANRPMIEAARTEMATALQLHTAPAGAAAENVAAPIAPGAATLPAQPVNDGSQLPAAPTLTDKGKALGLQTKK